MTPSHWASIVALASIACARPLPREPAQRLPPPAVALDAGAEVSEAPLDAGRGPATEAAADAVVVSPGPSRAADAVAVCPSMHAAPTTDARAICHAGTLPASAADVWLSADPLGPEVAAGGTLSVSVHVENRSGKTLELVVESVSLVVRDRRRVVFPPPGVPNLSPNPACRAVHCAAVTLPTASLLPGGTLEDELLWDATRVTWPPRQQESCCGPRAVSPVPGAPLPAGVYGLEVTVTLARQGGGHLSSTVAVGVEVTP